MKTDNSNLLVKINLRKEAAKGCSTVLDCYAGTGLLWRRSSENIKVTSIEKIKGKNRKALTGDNLKYLKSMNLQKFDVIDLDAYGIPFEQIKTILDRNYKGVVIVTAIQSLYGNLPTQLLTSLGYGSNMLKKIKSIFTFDGIGKLENYLYLRGIQTIKGITIGRKSYFYFNTNTQNNE